MRGLPVGREKKNWTIGITPACAGTTSSDNEIFWSRWDHPRVCGDYLSEEEERFINGGSPPRVRGLLAVLQRIMRLIGITPACAGTTETLFNRAAGPGDHPRVCGDYVGVPGFTVPPAGSPPRVRGLLDDQPVGPRHAGITPACAGTTRRRNSEFPASRDHPRVCGDYGAPGVTTPRRAGSPPRVRGLRTRPGRNSRDMGITPACAGTTNFIGLPSSVC